MRIKSARYGAANAWVDVTRVLDTLLRYSGEATVDNRLAGDPCPGIRKSCVVHFDDGSESEYQEHESLRLCGIQKTNLLYHICPITTGREQWRWNISQIKMYARWINGRRIVSVVQGRGIDPIDDVLHEFGDFPIDELIVRVNSDLWEMETFPHAIHKIYSTKPDEAFFYCHAKGTSKQAGSTELMAARLWASYMYRFLFGNPQKTLEALRSYSTVGSFKEENGPSSTHWHFTGTFWGIRHDRLFTRPNWNEWHRDRYFVEYYPNRHFPSEQALNLCPIKRPRSCLDWPSWQHIAPQIEQSLAEFGA
jgi:hypothetical protein